MRYHTFKSKILRWGLRPFSLYSFAPRVKTGLLFDSQHLKRKVRFDLYLPPVLNRYSLKGYPLLIFNDGQDLASMRFRECLESLYRKGHIPPVLVVGVFPGDRMQEYGTAKYPDYKNRGSRAKAYSQFLTEELIPFLESRYRLLPDRTIAGFSLGGLSAFDIAWHYPGIFRCVGVFSGSFWWRSTPFDPKDPDGNRIAHTMVANSTVERKLKFWFQTGTLDEKADRNNNGIIDAIDDTRDLIEELRKIGFHEGRDIHYVEIIGGRHDTATWAKIMPDFLRWSFGFWVLSFGFWVLSFEFWVGTQLSSC